MIDQFASTANWLSRVMATACFGERHLWQDLGLAAPDQLRTIFLTHYPSLGLRNTQGMRWKQFLFKELDTRLGGLVLIFNQQSWQADAE